MGAIDAVISWVDGYDPVYLHKLNSFCEEQGIQRHIAVEPTRINHCNEIHYCLLALERFAPWLRSIFIITNQQTPPAVSDLRNTRLGSKIQIIDQNELLQQFGSTAPVFNSISIEWLIWHIPGLSEQFIYLNDDFFIIRDVFPEDFFQNKQLILRGEWKVQADKKLSYQFKKQFSKCLGQTVPLPKTNPHRAWQEKSAQLAGWDKRFYLLPHAPFPLFKSSFTKQITTDSELFNANIRFPFRHPDQVSSIPLIVHHDLKQKRAVHDIKKQALMVNGESHSFSKIRTRLTQAQKNNNVAFVCMQSIDQAPAKVQAYMLNWLEQHIV
ncbi:Capsular polysaccharide phosphotransferase cps12A [Legionella birminghamensis]|uniref:Capsular polysaccharide phosphotransferase SacB n=1 Tax=Legionella birminghamensis TaxID=28083 RepID=A0A378IA89_9GAMM|nr:hypothetical protein [Legionella birminghamensis]KTC69439.1 Capsular polysaccharide phosphotransferase cps12A [Legionella birminghamensis]STX31680.1 Capsular polysaccharide phosphotransferase SacB [Legionella birminghamensis]